MIKSQCLPLSCWLDKVYAETNNIEITDGTYIYCHGSDFGIIYRYTNKWCVKPLGYFIYLNEDDCNFKFLKISDYL